MDNITSQEEYEEHFSQMIQEHDVDAVKICVYNYRCGSFPDTNINHFMCEAIKTGHVEVVKVIMVAPRIDLNYTDEKGRRPLHYAAEIGITEIASLLIRCGTAVNVVDSEGFTALHYACRYGQTETVKLLVKEGAHINRVRSLFQGEAPLHLASGGGFAHTVEMLISLGAKVNILSADSKQQTPLHKAVKGKKYDVIHTLCTHGADLSVTDAKGRTPLHLAAETGDIGTLCAILQHGLIDTPSDSAGRKPMHIAVETKQTLVIEALITATPNDIDARDRKGYTPLHVAALTGKLYSVQLLVEAKADVNLQTGVGETALNIAVSCGHLEVVEYLLANGACPNIPDSNGVTPLHKAQIRRASSRLPIIETLIRNGTKMNQTDNRGYTPLDRCVFQSVVANFDRETLKLMIAAGAHLQPKFAESRIHKNSPLCWLVWRGDLESARFLVYAGWDLRNENWLDLPGKDEEQTQLLNWLQKVAREPRSLMHYCRHSLRDWLLEVREDREILSSINALPLPGLLKMFMEFQGEKDLLDK